MNFLWVAILATLSLCELLEITLSRAVVMLLGLLSVEDIKRVFIY